MISFLQINLHRSSAAQNLLQQTVAERGSQVLLLSEQSWTPVADERWTPSTDGSCAVVLTSTADLVVESRGAGRGFAWIRGRGIQVYSCYNSRNDTEENFDTFLGDLEHSLRSIDHGINILMGGDFNAWSYEWGSSENDARGERIANLAASLDLLPANTGRITTYRRRNAESVIDVTFTRLRAPAIVKHWRVLEGVNSESDHLYIEFKYEEHMADEHIESLRRSGWAIRKLDEDALSRYIDTATWQNVTTSNLAADRLTEYLEEACNSSMPPRGTLRPGRRSVYWWSQEIADLRRESFRFRRLYQRAARKGAPTLHVETLRRDHRAKRKELGNAIKKAQQKSWDELCQSVESDPWGIPYRIVTKRIGRSRPGLEARGMECAIADHLFPTLPIVEWARETPIPTDGEERRGQEFSLEEIRDASCRLPSGKATGPDCIPNEVLRRVAKSKPQILKDTFNTCLREGKFPHRWKTARLVLLHKGAGKPIDDPSSYRPLCMINTTGKMLERLLLQRLNEHLDRTGQRSENQFGFRRGRSTEDAIERLTEIAHGAARGAVQHRDLCVVVSLDVRNAFNTVPWTRIDDALRKRGTPSYLLTMLRSYLDGRRLLVGEALHGRDVTCGVPQGSVLGPALWSVFYDELLEVEMPAGVQVFAFADDIAVIGTARTGEQAGAVLNPALEKVARWMGENGLELAPQKTEAVILTRKKRYEVPQLTVEGHAVDIKNSIRYLGVELDTRLSFTAHVATASKKAVEAARAVARLFPNAGGPSESKRALLGTVANSKMLYAAPVWAEQGTKTQKNRNAIQRAQRIVALRTIRAYRTVSTDASMVLASSLPGDILAIERARIRRRLDEAEPTARFQTIRKEERTVSIQTWQERWESSTKGRWTFRLLPNVERWINRPGARSTFHMSQALSGHGCFRSYLHRMKRAEDSVCLYCLALDETAEHTIFYCPHWSGKREVMRPLLNGRLPIPEDVSDILCGPTGWTEQGDRIKEAVKRTVDVFTAMVESILSEKEADERAEEERLRQLRLIYRGRVADTGL